MGSPAQVGPVRVRRLYKRQLPRAFPRLDILLPLDCMTEVLMEFVPDEAMHAVSGGEARALRLPVQHDPVGDISGHTGIERSVSLRGENVDEIGVHDEWNIS